MPNKRPLHVREPVPLPIAPAPGTPHDGEPAGPCGDMACADGCWTARSYDMPCQHAAKAAAIAACAAAKKEQSDG